MQPPVFVLSVGIVPITWPQLLDQIDIWVSGSDQHTVTYANAHVLNTSMKDPALSNFLNTADICYCDGNGVRLGAFLLGHTIPQRMTGADWIYKLAQAACGRWRIYWIGGEDSVTAQAAVNLQQQFGDLEIATDHGFHPKTSADNDACIRRINDFCPHIVLVGMGTPTQEHWVSEVRSKINAPVVWCVGATADYVAGQKSRPGPQWLIDRHEWISRLIDDPIRLWRRYLIGNPLFLARVLRSRQTSKRPEK